MLKDYDVARVSRFISRPKIKFNASKLYIKVYVKSVMNSCICLAFESELPRLVPYIVA